MFSKYVGYLVGFSVIFDQVCVFNVLAIHWVNLCIVWCGEITASVQQQLNMFYNLYCVFVYLSLFFIFWSQNFVAMYITFYTFPGSADCNIYTKKEMMI